MTTPTYMTALNSAQRKAVTFGEIREEQKGVAAGPLLVIAGAGTGKTNTLAHRVAYLAMNGVDPARILMLTFSRRAAQEMRRRARDIVKEAMNEPLGGLGQVLAQRLSWAGTFHSMANRLLRHYAPHLKLDPQFTVIDRGDSADLMDVIRQELGFDAKERRFPRRDTCLAIYSHRGQYAQESAGITGRAIPLVRAMGRGVDPAVSRLRPAQADLRHSRL